METKDVVGIILTAWANTIATIALIHSIRKDKKTAKRKQPGKQRKRKR